VEVHGRRVDGPSAAVRAGAGMLFQNPADQLLGPTVLEDVMLGPRHAGAAPAEARGRATEALAATGVAACAGRVVEALSYGERKRAGLDPAGELAVARLLREVAVARGAALLAATHAVDVAPLFAERALVLGEGRILADAPLREVLTDAALLARAALRPPWVAQLWAALRGGGPLPLTYEEALTWNASRS
ncbi:MAG: hypothetical protein ACJ79E_20320, partial [Anaeromyxobacteraceae bacterium]